MSLQVPSDSVLRNIETEHRVKDFRHVVITKFKCQSSLTHSVRKEIMCRGDSLDTGIKGMRKRLIGNTLSYLFGKILQK